MITASLQGSRYDIGLQHGRQLKTAIQCATRQFCRFFSEERAPQTAAVQDRAAALEQEFPEFLEELRGIADGADCPLHDVLVLNLGPWPQSCTNLVFLDSDAGPMLGHVNDHKPGGVFDALFRVRHDDGRKFLYVGSAGMLDVAAGLNSDGLAFSFSATRPVGLRNEQTPLNMNLRSRALIERCRDCGQARDFLARNSACSGGANLIVIDRSGSAFVAETQPTAVAFRSPENGGIYCTNRTVAPSMRALMGQDAYEKEAKEIPRLVRRERYLESMLTEHQGRLSLGLMEQVLRSSGEGIEICNEYSNRAIRLTPVPPTYSVPAWRTIRGRFSSLRNASVPTKPAGSISLSCVGRRAFVVHAVDIADRGRRSGACIAAANAIIRCPLRLGRSSKTRESRYACGFGPSGTSSARNRGAAPLGCRGSWG